MTYCRSIAAALISACLACTGTSAIAAPIFTDWTSIDFNANTASGNIGGISVSLTAGNIDYAIINGSSNVFSYSHYTPPLALSDALEVQGHGVTPHANSVTFSSPVTNIVIHIGSLASTLTFTLPDNTPIPVIYLSGSLTTSGNQAIGALSNSGPSDCPTDVCGTIALAGTFTSFNFTSFYHTWPGVFAPIDGIAIQLGADAVPAPGALTLFGFGLMTLIGLRRSRL